MSAQQGSKSSTEHASDQTFSELLKKISDLYKSRKYRWLRLLLNDHCSGDLLSENDITGHFLFNQLQTRGYISNNPTDVDFLIDIATITDHDEALRLTTEFNNQYNEEIHDSKYKRKPISEFRKKLFKALIANINPVAPMVLNYKKLNEEVFDNTWDFVFKLERELLLTEDKTKMKRFANCLDPVASAILLGEDDNPDAGTPMDQ
ncbi:uncharacterized protein [Antedon mediterranea]|uniref:uncharacterized protein isoform X2 n=1 Tax=Antedon mediterranea TaxID=105859 RepID=UPI003AF591CB